MGRGSVVNITSVYCDEEAGGGLYVHAEGGQ